MADEIQLAFVPTNGLHLTVAQAGASDGPLVILLHGFPEFWYGWRKQIPALAATGFCVWAPNQRGYGESDRPQQVRQYTLDQLVGDVTGLIAAAGRQRAAIIGHDWGGAVAWWLAANNPELVERLVILNVPNPFVMRRLILSNPRQTMRSWYVFALQIPWLPEWAARRNNWQSLIRGMQDSSRPGTFTETDFERYRQEWSRPGAFTAMVNWYRAAFRFGASRPRNVRIMPPTLILWGQHDRFVIPEAAEASLALCDQGKLEFYADATHWLQHEEDEEVNRRILEFLGGRR